MRILVPAIILILAGCGGEKPATDPQLLKSLRSQADEYAKAMQAEDNARIVDLTHPTLVEQLGGREKMLQMQEALSRGLRNLGSKITKVTLAEPTDVVATDGTHFGIVPMTIDVEAGEQKSAGQSYLIGISTDGGKKWAFLDAVGFGGQRDKIKVILPKFPDSLKLPSIARPEHD